MRLPLSVPLIVGLLLLAMVPERAGAQLKVEAPDSIVRIICPEPAENGGKGFYVWRLDLSNNESVDCVNAARGTGFVITGNGMVVTNNHVVATEQFGDTPRPLVMVLQKAGERYLLHKATILWLCPNADLAIIQAPDLKAAPLPLEFDASKYTPSEEVYSMGFPGITDLGAENFQRSEEARGIFARWEIDRRVKAMAQQKQRKLTKTEIDAIEKDVASNGSHPSVDMMELLAGMNAVLQKASDAATTWDVSEVIARKLLWANFFKPTVTKGDIQRTAKIHGYLGVTHPDVLMIQHSCRIMHGNSGGPLLNAGGQVIGVVGDSLVNTMMGDTEEIQLATAAGELKEWLEAHKIPYVPAGEWRKALEPVKIIERQPTTIVQQLPATIVENPTLKVVEHLPRKMIAAFGLAVAVALAIAIAAGIFSVLKSQQAPSITKLLRDPRLAKALGNAAPIAASVESQPGELRLHRAPEAVAGASLTTWQLAGENTKGDKVCVEFTDVLFAENDQRLVLGRIADLCHLVVEDESISKQHAHIRKEGTHFFVADRNSANHTMLNGLIRVKVFEEAPMKEGDTLTLGEVRLDFRQL